MSQHFVNRVSPLAPNTRLAIDGGAFKGPIYDVTHPDFGAVGDGVHDDTSAFALWSAAINASTAPLGFIPKGTFKVFSTPSAPAISITNHLARIEGASMKSSVISDGGSGTTFQIATSANGGFAVKRLQLIAAVKAFVAINCQELLFEHLYVSSCVNHGWEMDTCVDVVWKDCHTTGGCAGHGVFANGNGECNGWKLLGGRFSGSRTAGKSAVWYEKGTVLTMVGTICESWEIAVRLGASVLTRCVDINAYFEDYSSTAIYAGNSTVEALNIHGSYFNARVGGSAIVSKALGATIKGNRFVGNVVDIQTIAGAQDNEIGPNTTDNTGANYVTDGGARTRFHDETGRTKLFGVLPVALSSMSADRGDANVTLQVGTDNPMQRFATALTANRTITLNNTLTANGDWFWITRAGGAFNLDVGGLKTLTANQWALVARDSGAWRLVATGSL